MNSSPAWCSNAGNIYIWLIDADRSNKWTRLPLTKYRYEMDHSWTEYRYHWSRLILLWMCVSAIVAAENSKRISKSYDQNVVDGVTNQLVPHTVDWRSLKLTNQVDIVNRFSVNRSVQSPYWTIQRNVAATDTGVTGDAAAAAAAERSRHRSPLSWASHTTNDDVHKWNHGKSASLLNVQNKQSASLDVNNGDRSNSKWSLRHQQHVSSIKHSQYAGLNSRNTNNNSDSNSNSNSIPKSSIEVVKSNLSKQIVGRYDVVASDTQQHTTRISHALSVATTSNGLRANNETTISQRKTICIPCRVIPGQPTHRLARPTMKRPWAWDRGRLLNFNFFASKKYTSNSRFNHYVHIPLWPLPVPSAVAQTRNRAQSPLSGIQNGSQQHRFIDFIIFLFLTHLLMVDVCFPHLNGCEPWTNTILIQKNLINNIKIFSSQNEMK